MGLLVAFHAYRFWSIYAELGLFRRLAFDWTLFYAQAFALRSGESGVLYDLRTLDRYLQVLTPYTANPAEPLVQWPVPYPPLFAWLLIHFTLPPPPLGFTFCMGVNLVAALHLGFRVSQLLPDLARVWAILAVLAPVPVALAGLTLLGTMPLWRGRWEPQDDRFPAKFCAIVLATPLRSYHSHLHGATRSAVPLAAAWAHGILSRFTRLSVLVAVFLPSLILIGVAVFWQRRTIPHSDDPRWLAWPGAFPAVLLRTYFGGLLADLWLGVAASRRVWRARAGPASKRMAPWA